MILFIRNENQPVGRIGCGSTYPAFEFSQNRLFVADDDATLLWHLRAEGYEEVDPADPRHDYIVTEGWGRLAKQHWERTHPAEEEPAE